VAAPQRNPSGNTGGWLIGKVLGGGGRASM
jgi:hypothetical protein